MKAPRLPVWLIRWAAPALLAAGLALSFGLAWLVQLGQESRAGQNVSTLAEQVGREIRNDVDTYGTILRGLHGLFIHSAGIDRDAFRQYVDLLRLQHDAAPLQGFSFIEREGAAFVVRYVAPLAGNETLVGRKIADHPAAGEALARAMAGGGLTLSAPFRLELASAGDTGLILFLPLYASDDPRRPYAATGRRMAALVGVTINIDQALLGIAGPLAQRHVHLRLTELERAWAGDAAHAPRPFFDSARGAATAAPAWLTARQEIAVLGNRWRLDLAAQPAAIPPATRFAPQFALALGLALTLLLYLLVRSLGRTGARASARAAQAAEEIRHSEAMFRDLTELSSDWYWEQDAALRFTVMSGGVVNKGNFRIAATLGKTRWELPILGVSEDEWAQHRALLDRREPFRDFIYRIEPGDGRTHWYSVSGKPMFDDDGRFTGYRGTGHDITLARQAEEQLRLAATVFEHSLEGVTITDAGGAILSVNRAFCEITGYGAEEVIGRNPRLLQSGRHDAAFYRAMWDSIRAKGHWRGEVWNRRKNGDIYPELLGICAVPGQDGQPSHYVGMFTDITELKRSEDAVRRFNAELERRVAERTAALTASNQELEAFSYSVSHDLRAPLRAIDGFTHVIAEDYADRLDAAAHGHLARIRAASQRMGAIIDDMLELARIARVEPQREEVDLSALAAAVCEELPKDPARRVELAIAPNVHAQADPRLMHIVLQNLLHNAWKFTSRTGAARIAFGETEIDGERAFFVRDNGAGFDPAHTKNLFGAFQRLHRPDEFPGHGIGLATVARIVQRHGGRVWAEAAVGEGAAFFFTLPAPAS